MNLKGAILTCVIVVVYLTVCSWRFEVLNERDEVADNQLAINVK